MKLEIRIQTIGKREWWLRNLLFLLNDKRVKPIYGSGFDLWTDAKKVLTSYSKKTTHLLVLQDDVLPCKNFISAAEKLISLLPEEPISLFSNSSAVETALLKNKSWVKLKTWFMAQGYIMPTSIIPDLIKWVDEKVKPTTRFDDERFAMYFFYHEHLVYATVPSLVEHLGWNSTLLRNYKNYEFQKRRDLRMATVFIGLDKDPLNIDWTEGLKDPVIDNEGHNSQFCDNLL